MARRVLTGKSLVDVEPPLPPVTINGVSYPCNGWEVTEEGRTLERKWTQGFMGGIADYVGRRSDTCYNMDNLDVTSPPFIRISKLETSFTATASFDRTLPLYAIQVQSAGGDNFVYLLNSRYGVKVDIANNNEEQLKDFGANAQVGHPALFEGKWHISLGASVNAVTLDTITNDGGAADTFSDIGTTKALHFAAGLDKAGVAQLARAHSTNKIDLSADGSDFTGADFEVGDSSLGIKDLLTFGGELMVIKQDSPYLFDVAGNSRAIQDFVGKSITPFFAGVSYAEIGANSYNVGQFAYWIHSSGTWRIVADQMFPTSPESADDFVSVTAPAGAVPQGDFVAITGWGRYVYATSGLRFFVGIIQRDGLITWLQAITTIAGGVGTARAAVSEGPSNPILWVIRNTTQVTRYNLAQDGSMRDVIGTARGKASTSSSSSHFSVPVTDFGFPDKTKQLRRIWANLEAEWGSSDGSLQAIVSRDRGAAANVGSAMQSAGLNEVTFTSGTSDTCREVQLGFTFSWNTSAGDTTIDPRVRSFGIEAVTPSIYRVLIPLTSARLRSVAGHSIRQSLKNLRDLKGGAGVTIKGSGEESATFTGKVVSVREKAVRQAERRIGYEVTVMIERYGWADGK